MLVSRRQFKTELKENIMATIGSLSSLNANSLAELQSRLAEKRDQAFAKADADKSGELTFKEFESIRQNNPLAEKLADKVPGEKIFSALDTDKNGTLSKEEFTPKLQNNNLVQGQVLASLLTIQEQFSNIDDKPESLNELLNFFDEKSDANEQSNLLSKLLETIEGGDI